MMSGQLYICFKDEISNPVPLGEAIQDHLQKPRPAAPGMVSSATVSSGQSIILATVIDQGQRIKIVEDVDTSPLAYQLTQMHLPLAGASTNWKEGPM